MAINNLWKYSETRFLYEIFLKHTGNEFKVVTANSFHKEGTGTGIGAELLILKDNAPEGFYGEARDDISLNTFKVTILNGRPDDIPRKGENIKLIGFIEELSFVIGFDAILRFEDFERIEKNKGVQK